MVQFLLDINLDDPSPGQLGWAPQPQHFDRLQGGETIATSELIRTQEAVARACRKRSITALYGQAGLGKTFALRSVIAKLDDVVPFWIEFDRKPTLREVVRCLYVGIFGEEPTGTRARIVDEVVAALEALAKERTVLVVIDEAQRLTQDCLEQLRRVHELVPSGFALVLAGGNNCWKVIESEPMLRSRVTRPVHFRAMSKTTILKVMPKFHEIYKDVPTEVLLSINRSFAHGNFRNWVTFTSTAVDYMEENGIKAVDQEFAKKVIRLLNGS